MRVLDWMQKIRGSERAGASCSVTLEMLTRRGGNII